MSELNLKYGEYQKSIPAPASVADALKAFDRDAAKKSLAAKLNGEEVDLNKQIEATDQVLSIEPILPDSRDGLELLRHSTAHLLAAAVLDLFPGTQLGVGPALMEDPRYGFYYDVIAPRQLTEADLPVIEKKMREQISVLPITDRINEYAEKIGKELKDAGFRVEVNTKSDKIGAKIREAQMQKVPFMLVLGDKELEENKIAVREKTKGDIGQMTLAEFKELARRLKETRALTNN